MEITRSGALSAPILPLDEAKQQARVDSNDEDDGIEFYALAATDWVEDACQTKLFRSEFTAVGSRFCLSFTGYPDPEIKTVRYVDLLGATITLDDSRYEIRDGWLVLHEVDQSEISTATVIFDAGLGAARVPPKLVQAIRMLSAHFYKHRESVAEGLAPVPMGVRDMVSMHRSFAFA